MVHDDVLLSPPLWAVSSWTAARFTACKLSMNREIRMAVRLEFNRVSLRSADTQIAADTSSEAYDEKYYAHGSENAMTLLSRRTSGVAIYTSDRKEYTS